MKITKVECIPVQAPGRTFVVVQVETDEGITGIGEAGWQRRAKAIVGAIEHMSRWLVGEDPFRIEHLWQRMSRGAFYPADRLIGSAVAGVDIALWDIKGQALGVPVYELLGGRCRDYVQAFALPLRRSGAEAANPRIDDKVEAASRLGDPDATVELAERYLALGDKFFRFGMPWPAQGSGYDPRRAARLLVAKMRAVRQKYGDKLELMVDLHTRLNPPDAIWFCRAVEPLDVFLVEDPIRAENMASYRHIREHVNVPLAAGEQWANKWEFRQVIEEELVDYVRMDVCLAGGLTEAKKIAGWAETHYIQILPHNPLGPISTAACLHLNASCNNAGPQEIGWGVPGLVLPDVFECAFSLEGDRLTLPKAPGIGVKFNRKAALAHPLTPIEPPHFRREDGAFTNY